MSASRAKGTAFESAVCRLFNELGFPHVERRALSGANDKGDLYLPGWVIECKNAKRLELGAWMTETEREARNANVDQYALVVKRRMRGIDEAYAIQPLRKFIGQLWVLDNQ